MCLIHETFQLGANICILLPCPFWHLMVPVGNQEASERSSRGAIGSSPLSDRCLDLSSGAPPACFFERTKIFLFKPARTTTFDLYLNCARCFARWCYCIKQVQDGGIPSSNRSCMYCFTSIRLQSTCKKKVACSQECSRNALAIGPAI